MQRCAETARDGGYTDHTGRPTRSGDAPMTEKAALPATFPPCKTTNNTDNEKVFA